jgi:hypothetical protein
MLVKSGYEQIPLGLFSDSINYDRQYTYEEMVKLVHDELKKLPPPLEGKVGKTPLGGKHPPGGKPGQPGKPGGQGGTPGGEPGGGKPGETEEEIHGKIEKGLNGKKEEEGEDGEDGEGGSGRGRGKSGNPGGPGGIKLTDVENQIKPKFNWKTLLSRCVNSATPEIVDTYAKPARRAVTGVHIAAQLGAAAIKPGEKIIDNEKHKMIFVLDTSGSMYDAIRIVGSELKNLMKIHNKKMDASFGVVYFAGDEEFFDVNIGKNYYSPIPSFAELGKSSSDKHVKEYIKVFEKMDGGGTVFSKKLASQLETLAGQGYNIMIFSDNDLAGGPNLNNLKDLYDSNPKNVFFIGKDRSVFVTICKQFGFTPGNFSFFN